MLTEYLQAYSAFFFYSSFTALFFFFFNQFGVGLGGK